MDHVGENPSCSKLTAIYFFTPSMFNTPSIRSIWIYIEVYLHGSETGAPNRPAARYIQNTSRVFMVEEPEPDQRSVALLQDFLLTARCVAWALVRGLSGNLRPSRRIGLVAFLLYSYFVILGEIINGRDVLWVVAGP